MIFDSFFFQPKPYAFTYGVKDEYSGTDFSRAEERSGEAIRGSYKVALPDGRVQIVSYVADDDGYKATVTYEGEPSFPSPEQYKSGPGATPEVFHALPPVTADISHAFFEAAPKAVTPEPVLYDEYEYYDEPIVVTPKPTYASPTPKPIYASPTPLPYSPTPKPYSPTPQPYTPSPTYGSPTPKPVYASPTPKPVYASPTPKPVYASPTPQPAYGTPTPPPAYGSPTPQPAYGYSTPAPSIDPIYGSPTPLPYVASTTIKSLRPKKYGLKIPNYSTLGPHHIFYAPTTYAPPVSPAYNSYKEVFKRKAAPLAPSIDEYDYEYYEDSDYIYSPNRRSARNSKTSNLNHQVQLVIAEHLHEKK